jgi:hypothetical protein
MNHYIGGGCFRFRRCARKTQGAFMPATGEVIRLMNYIDDIATTLRRISASIPAMTREECARLGEYIRKSEPSYESVVQHLELVGKEKGVRNDS